MEVSVQLYYEHDAVVVRSATRITDEVLAGGGRLRVIGRAGTGVDNIDVKAATRKGVLVMNSQVGLNGSCTQAGFSDRLATRWEAARTPMLQST
ncbi:D-3-phosphoglycerate dehydrogenase [Portunus trituberculatus]|uniref:D-3-phosphoglycerate dehydrogenase n=1 Tax=Portunus trituberculatus TaxID=210409 RepID=A0A5B7IQW4_PORTR|nr:D-3-phosphoglycerate dehydrogenase [Portunus trituberculatus]